MVGTVGAVGIDHHAAGIEDGAAIAELVHFDAGNRSDSLGTGIGLRSVRFGQRLEVERHRFAQGLVAEGAVGSQAVLFLEGDRGGRGGVAEEAIDATGLKAGAGEELLPFGDIVAVGIELEDTHGGVVLLGRDCLMVKLM